MSLVVLIIAIFSFFSSFFSSVFFFLFFLLFFHGPFPSYRHSSSNLAEMTSTSLASQPNNIYSQTLSRPSCVPLICTVDILVWWLMMIMMLYACHFFNSERSMYPSYVYKQKRSQNQCIYLWGGIYYIETNQCFNDDAWREKEIE